MSSNRLMFLYNILVRKLLSLGLDESQKSFSKKSFKILDLDLNIL